MKSIALLIALLAASAAWGFLLALTIFEVGR
jgi:hypothetical protein